MSIVPSQPLGNPAGSAGPTANPNITFSCGDNQRGILPATLVSTEPISGLAVTTTTTTDTTSFTYTDVTTNSSTSTSETTTDGVTTRTDTVVTTESTNYDTSYDYAAEATLLWDKYTALNS